MIDLVLDALVVLLFSALIALELATPGRFTRVVRVSLALAALGVCGWRAVRDGEWWMAAAGVAVAVVWIGVDTWRARRALAA